MAAPGKSRWGSLLSQAVAGIEARLDDVLADKEGTGEEQKASVVAAPVPSGAAAPAKPSQSPGPSRTASTGKPNDRLQERLARAIAARSTTPTGTKPESGSQPGPDSLQSSPRRSVDTAGRSSIESSGPAQSAPISADATKLHEEASPAADAVDGKLQEPAHTAEPEGKDSEERIVEVNGASALGDAPLAEAENAAVANGEVADEVTQGSADATTVHETPNAATEASQVADVKMKALEEVVLQHQEETHGYVEQIDALQAKLQYLSREASESARKAAQAAPAGSLEKRLAEKDQQIAQLLEEGKVLAATEQKHRTIIKKLRGRITEMEKESTDAHISRAKIDTEVDALRRKAKRTDELEKSNDDLQRRLDQVQRELSTAKSENSAKTTQISELQIQLRRLTQQAEALATKVNDEARDQDRKRIAELEESVAALQVEKNLVADRGKQQTNDWKEKAERATERARMLELELKAELQVMESKLEASRVRAEEASSGAVGDSQAKLMRQVETLQSQYSIASDNWQGIEATLLARVANLEKERDEAQQRESEMRKKAREATLRAKRTEEELEESKEKLPKYQDEFKSQQAQLDLLRKQAEDAQASLQAFKAEHDKERQAWEARLAERQVAEPQERRGWLDDIPGNHVKSGSRPESPAVPQRTLSNDLLGLQSLSSKMRKQSAPSSNGELGTPERSMFRRGSALPSHATGILSPGASTTPSANFPFSPMEESIPTPASQTAEKDDAFDGVETSSSPQGIVHDMVSVSTVAAGPSVQLVERMSAGIRRLESEKVAAREELSRIQGQRDEARAEIVALMKEVEASRTATTKVSELEAQVAEINDRYQTTLELLGEKTEMVEELRADVQDVKAMYRDLVERTIK